jgi:hypothetical protein
MRFKLRYVLPALVLGGLALALGFFSARSGGGASGDQHAAILPAGVANAATDETTSTIQIQRADGKIDEFTVNFKVDGVERSDGLILVSGSANGVFVDAYPIAIQPDDKVLSITPAVKTGGLPAAPDGKPTPTPVAGGEGPLDAGTGHGGTAASGETIGQEHSIVDPSPKIGPEGPEPPTVP